MKSRFTDLSKDIVVTYLFGDGSIYLRTFGNDLFVIYQH
jgi:hypothetical protein